MESIATYIRFKKNQDAWRKYLKIKDVEEKERKKQSICMSLTGTKFTLSP